MPAYCLTPDAQSDLLNIQRFTVEQWGASQSLKYLTELRASMQLIAETPALGKGRPDVGLDVLSFPQGSHVIYYVVHEQQIIVFGVLHKRMVPLNHLAERRKE
ncbi:type II toxin-antitoxin system RelE/ParE family toxin [Endozoicomonas ascidiicola]|uniref:type II toxin-antitoxin system RelE/ParE family toxin n=1 Tax=Endozoicomonas ascidiicola TaxID=1698521 RepID=UPI00082BF89D|nr:type II toxin-antitoxin system RelE/ParE family toxin [Endozoicomonas ascidiicola]